MTLNELCKAHPEVAEHAQERFAIRVIEGMNEAEAERLTVSDIKMTYGLFFQADMFGGNDD